MTSLIVVYCGEKPFNLGLRGSMFNALRSLYHSVSSCVRVNGRYKEWLENIDWKQCISSSASSASNTRHKLHTYHLFIQDILITF